MPFQSREHELWLRQLSCAANLIDAEIYHRGREVIAAIFAHSLGCLCAIAEAELVTDINSQRRRSPDETGGPGTP
jgi:hypothetical protein